MNLLDRLRDRLENGRLYLSRIELALRNLDDLEALGFSSVEALGYAWQDAERRAGSEAALAAALRRDVDRVRQELYDALVGRGTLRLETGPPSLFAVVDVAVAAIRSFSTKTSRSSIEPRWDYVARAIPLLDEVVKSEPLYVGRVDRIGARIRDQYDELGLQVTDEDVLYVTLVVLGMVVELASDGVRNGSATPAALRNLAAVTQTYAAALIPYLPAEARK